MEKSTYTIKITNNTKLKNSPVANNNLVMEQRPNAVQRNFKDSLTAIIAIDRFAMPFVEQTINYKVSTISLRTGAIELQQRVQFGMNVAKQAIGIGATIMTGLVTGNPLLVIGGLVSATTVAINYANQAKSIKVESELEGIILRGLNERAGGYTPSYSTSRRGDY